MTKYGMIIDTSKCTGCYIIRLIINHRQAATLQLINTVHKTPELDAIDINHKSFFQSDGNTEARMVNSPEISHYFPAEVPVLIFFFQRLIPRGQPVPLIEPEQFFQRRRRRGTYFKKILDAVVKSRTEAEI